MACETKLSPRIEDGAIKWYKGDAFYLYIDLVDDETGNAFVIKDTDKIILEFYQNGNPLTLATVETKYIPEDMKYECFIDEKTTSKFQEGKYTYKIIYLNNFNKTKQTIENCGNIEVEGVCQCQA